MSYMFVTCDVSKEERSSEVRPEHSLNMAPILLNRDVSSLERSIVVQFFMPSNHIYVDFGRTASTNLTDLTW